MEINRTEKSNFSNLMERKFTIKEVIEEKIKRTNSKLKIPFISVFILIEVECKNAHSLKIKPGDFIRLGDDWCEECNTNHQKFINLNYGEYLFQTIGELKNSRYSEKTKYRNYIKIPKFENERELPLAYCYVRTSTYTSQFENGFSVETQEQELMEWCKQNNLFIKFISYDIGLSGGSLNGRYGLQKILDEIESKSTFVTLEMSRISRNDRDFENIMHEIKVVKKCKFFYVRDVNPDLDTIDGYIIHSFRKLQNVLESREISKRTKIAMRDAAKRDELRSRPKYGYRFVGKNRPFVKDDYEQSVIKFIREFISMNPGCSIQSVIYELEEKNYKPPRGARKFYHASVKNIMIQNNIMKPITYD